MIPRYFIETSCDINASDWKGFWGFAVWKISFLLIKEQLVKMKADLYRIKKQHTEVKADLESSDKDVLISLQLLSSTTQELFNKVFQLWVFWNF